MPFEQKLLQLPSLLITSPIFFLYNAINTRVSNKKKNLLPHFAAFEKSQKKNRVSAMETQLMLRHQPVF